MLFRELDDVLAIGAEHNLLLPQWKWGSCSCTIMHALMFCKFLQQRVLPQIKHLNTPDHAHDTLHVCVHVCTQAALTHHTKMLGINMRVHVRVCTQAALTFSQAGYGCAPSSCGGRMLAQVRP